MPGVRRRKLGLRRRVEDEGDDDGREDDSLSDGSLSDDDAGLDSDTSKSEKISSTPPNAAKSATLATSTAPRPHEATGTSNGDIKLVSDTDMMLHGLSIDDKLAPSQEMDFDEVVASPPKSPSAPVVVSSASAVRQQQPPGSNVDRRRQEHEDYKRRRDEDPAFVPNRGSFFMHDHRHAGPAANGFRPFGRARGRGGRYGAGATFPTFGYVEKDAQAATISLPFAHLSRASVLTFRSSHTHQPSDPTTTSPWTHDMHDFVAEPGPRRPRPLADAEGPPNGDGLIRTCSLSITPINRALSTEKHIGNAQVRVFLPNMKKASLYPGVAVKQYTNLPDHRPPLRRDKPVRISLPHHHPRYIFPALDRSFTFIPRALRPNQQRVRGKPRSTWGSNGGFSRRTSIFGGSYYGSTYSPSLALSRRSSIVHERDYVFSPTASVTSRPPMPADNIRPIVRLPPSGASQPTLPMPANGPALDSMYGPAPMAGPGPGPVGTVMSVPNPTYHAEQMAAIETSTINGYPGPQGHPQPHKLVVQENAPNSIPMHQPRPQKNISVADIETPMAQTGAAAGVPQAFQQAFHQQVPPQVANGYGQDSHSRRPSYQQSTGTPLSHIPERAIHAAPFQPTSYGQPAYYGQQMYSVQPQQGFYYPSNYPGPTMTPSAAAPAFVPNGQPGPVPSAFAPMAQTEQSPASHGHGHNSSTGSNLVAQEVNGMVYYFDASQIAPVNSYPPYSAPPSYQNTVMSGAGVVTPSPDGFYYPQPTPGMVYYPQ
ncbi:extensin [Moelleriella libera RCEF 2490]|uniref:Extensin n=1 Tax=Moelleriella libera RCEF 2490 TaxID=1081109 RepID=A0A168ERA2_9HYPO|nr:extensin [Moelleriella libera RCEF 2490]